MPRQLNINGRSPSQHPRFQELLQKSSSGTDVVIHHYLPRDYQYDGRLLNVGMFATETSHFTSSWADRINMMDLAVVFNRQQDDACRRSGVTIPVEVVPHTLDISEFQQSYPFLPHLDAYKGKFIFLFVGEFVRRKNLAALLKAFYLEFSEYEPVELVIKTSKPGLSPIECRDMVTNFCEEISRGLKLPNRKKPLLLTENLSHNGVMRLYASCDVTVSASYGEAFSLPNFHAMALGKPPIVTDCTGFREYCDADNAWLVEGRSEPCFGVLDSVDDLFSGDETWTSIDVCALRRAMRESYENPTLRQQKSSKCVERAYDFSYEKVGQALTHVIKKAKANSSGLD